MTSRDVTFRSLLAAAGAAGALLGAGSAVQAQTTPQIVTVPATSNPPVPAGLKVTCTPNPNTGAPSPTCPVIQYGGFTTWAYSFQDNRVSYGIVTYDAQGNVVRNLTRDGARYVYKITSDPTARTLSIWGQSDAKVDIAWTDLPQPPAPGPQIVTVPAGGNPPLPDGLKVTCTPNPNTGAPSPTCPVIQYNGVTTWAYSFMDNRVSYGIVSYDAQGAVLQNLTRDGARYVYKITSDPVARTVSIWGQGDAKVDIAWAQLPSAPPTPPVPPTPPTPPTPSTAVYSWTPASAPPANAVLAPVAPSYPVCRAAEANGLYWVGWWDGTVCHGSYGNNLRPVSANLQFLTVVSGPAQWTTPTSGPNLPSVLSNAISGGPTPSGNYDQLVCAYGGYVGWVYSNMCEHNGPHAAGSGASVVVGTLQ
jgi:hypothetical protein